MSDATSAFGPRPKVYHLPDGTLIVLPRREYGPALWFAIAFALLVAFVVRNLPPRHFLDELVFLVSPTLLICIGWLTERRRCTSITAHLTSQRLTIEQRGWLLKRRVWCPRTDIRALDVWDGLCLALAGGNLTRIASHRTWAELIPLAETLREFLRVPRTLPPKPGELAVTYHGTLWPEPVPAILSMKPGRMKLRHSFIRKPYLVFGAESGMMTWMLGGIIPVEPPDVSCSITTDGAAILNIAPAGFGCRFMREFIHDKPQVTKSWQGRFLRDCSSQVTQLPWGKRDFYLTISCKEGDILTSALALFWGGSEKDARTSVSVSPRRRDAFLN